MIPILYEPTETAFTSFGVGALIDVISCHVVEELNGQFTLEMEYPIIGEHYDEIRLRSLILAAPNPTDRAQPFRVTRITRPINGIVTIYAEHISYDLAGVPVGAFTANTAAGACAAINQHVMTETPFTVSTDKSTIATMATIAPTAFRSLLGGVEGSLLEVYGGEYVFDRFDVRLLAARGADHGVRIRYGVDLIDLSQEESCAAVYTGALGYWRQNDATVQGQIQSAGSFDYSRVLVVDLTDKFDGQPTVEQLNEETRSYIARNQIGVPRISLTVNFAQLEQTDEYANIRRSVALGDLVGVDFERLGVSASAKVIGTDYDVITERFRSASLGDRQANLADTIAQIQDTAGHSMTKTAMEAAIKSATELITGVTGGSAVWGFDSEGRPVELFFLDTDSVSTARDCLRINRNGIGFSHNGVAGPFETAWTIDGTFYADYILGGTLNADNLNVTNINGQNIKAGTIGSTPLASGAVTETKVGSLAISNSKIQGGAVSYGKTSFTGTLDQVGVNKSNIEAINSLFASTLACNIIQVNAYLRVKNLATGSIQTFQPRSISGRWVLAV